MPGALCTSRHIQRGRLLAASGSGSSSAVGEQALPGNIVCVQRGPVRIAECWFEQSTAPPADVVRFMHVEHRVAGAHCTAEPTITIDLNAAPEALLAGMKNRARTAIRRAEREGYATNLWFTPDDRVLHAFGVFYDAFARQKRLPPVDRGRLRVLRQAGMLCISSVAAPQGEVVAWHSYLCAGTRVRVLQSASLFRDRYTSAERNALGRANRYLHIIDMLAFRERGFRVYDLGGWYPGTRDIERLKINQFKEDFGGRIVTHYRCEMGVTLVGTCALVLARLKHSLMRLGRKVSRTAHRSRSIGPGRELT